MLFSIVIPNWNGEKFLKRCLESLNKQTLHDFEVILVDDGSSDNSAAFTRKNFPEVKILESKKNSGFAAAANRGIKASRGKLIALLNNDTEVEKDWLLEIKKAAEKNDDAGFFSSKMLDFSNRNIIDSCGIGVTWSGRSYNIGMGEKDSDKYSQDNHVFGACAGAAVYRKELLDQIGLFDEDFYMYVEDVDLSYRAQITGYKCVFVAKAKVYHLGSGSSGGKGSPLAFKMCMRNRWFFMYKNYPATKLLANIHRIAYSEARYFSSAVRDHFVGEYFEALRSALMNFPKIVKKRKKIQRSYKVSYDYLDQIIEKKFAYKPLAKALKNQSK